MFLFEIFMIFLGMIISTVFQDPINAAYLKLKRFLFRLFYKKKKSGIEQAECFILGDRPTSVVVVDGDGEGVFENHNLVVHIQETFPYELPEAVVQLREKTVAELERRKAAGEDIPWNGSQLSLYKYAVSRTADFEDYKLELFLAKTDYYSVYSTIHNLDSGEPSLRQAYLDTFEFENNQLYRLPNGVGLCLCVRTKDNKMIFATRSMNSGFRPGQNDVSVVEGLSPQYDMTMHTLDLVGACKRAVREEIGKIEEDKLDVSVLGLVLDKEYNQWNFIGSVYVNLTQDQIISRRNSGTAGKWELKSLDFVKYHPKDVFQYISTHTIWDMGIIATYFALVHNGYSKPQLEQMIKKYLR